MADRVQRKLYPSSPTLVTVCLALISRDDVIYAMHEGSDKHDKCCGNTDGDGDGDGDNPKISRVFLYIQTIADQICCKYRVSYKVNSDA